MKNAPGLGPRQRRQVQAMLGRFCENEYQLQYILDATTHPDLFVPITVILIQE